MRYEEIEKYYADCGNTTDVRDWLKSKVRYETSFDGSLSVFFFKEFSVLVCCSYIQKLGV